MQKSNKNLNRVLPLIATKRPTSPQPQPKYQFQNSTHNPIKHPKKKANKPPKPLTLKPKKQINITKYELTSTTLSKFTKITEGVFKEIIE
jgi:hypothetical protein